MMNLIWNPKTTEAKLQSALRTLGEEYPLLEEAATAKDGVRITFSPGSDTCLAQRDADGIHIVGGSLPARLRTVGAILAGLLPVGATVEETCPLTTFGIMLDCSRNAVMKVEHLKQWMRRLALLGYNQVMLYTEDTYEIPGEPRFGFQRGRYTQVELKALDVYAASLGIELVGCIQTLGHLAQILRWNEYQDVKDFGSTLLAGEPKTYALIERMLDSMGESLQTRRIHIGMDEAIHLGRGVHLDRHGARRRFDVFNEHLAEVVRLCRARGLEPMIWSDMYFAMGSPSHNYYDPACVIPDDVVAAIPAEVQLVYWDYYHKDAAFYREWIGRHRAMHYEPIVASALWTWAQFWYNAKDTELNAGPCVEACLSEGIKEFFFCLWGDDGAVCDFDSALAGLAWGAEQMFSNGQPDEARLAARFRAICGADYADIRHAGSINRSNNHGNSMLWDDPILGIFFSEGLPLDTHPTWPEVCDQYAMLAAELKGSGDTVSAGDLQHARLIASILERKMRLQVQLMDAYARRDHSALAAVRDAALSLAPVFEELEQSWRRGWMRRNKPQGFEVIQLRMAQQTIRHRELAQRIEELLNGTVSAIPELDERPREAKGTGVGWSFFVSGSNSL